jgi:hypothetical protein
MADNARKQRAEVEGSGSIIQSYIHGSIDTIASLSAALDPMIGTVIP